MGSDLAQRVKANNTPAAESAGGGAVQVLTLKDQIRKMESEFAVAMPRGAEAAQLIRDALTLLRTQKDLDKCDAPSVLGGLMTCAQLGLRPGVLGHAWLIPFWDKNFEWLDDRGRQRKGHLRAQLIIGYQGYRELAFRTGQVASVVGRIVHANDHFDVEYGMEDRLVHKPRLDGDRGDAVGYYSVVKYVNGGCAFWFMSKTDCEKHRDRYAMAKTKEGRIVGPWRDNFDEQSVKTTFRMLAKWMPKSTELAAAVEADGSVRVDLSPTNKDAILHAEHPSADVEDAEVVDEPATEREPSEVAKQHNQHTAPTLGCELCDAAVGDEGEA